MMVSVIKPVITIAVKSLTLLPSRLRESMSPLAFVRLPPSGSSLSVWEKIDDGSLTHHCGKVTDV